MNLSTPPPGAAQAPEIMPAVLQAGRSPRPPATRTASAAAATSPDALAGMLSRSSVWENHRAPVSMTVTLASWLSIALNILAIYLNYIWADQDHIFARIITWNHHPTVAIAAAAAAAAAMTVTAVMTRGLRRADIIWLRMWIGAAAASAIAIASIFIALIVGLVLVVVGLVVAAATLAVVLFVGAVLGMGIGQSLGG
jgi:hypothetical protein